MAIYKVFQNKIEREMKNRKYTQIKQRLFDDVKSISEGTP
jgi:hypothetical protein